MYLPILSKHDVCTRVIAIVRYTDDLNSSANYLREICIGN